MPLYTAVYSYHDTEQAQLRRAELAGEHKTFVEDLLARNVIVVATLWGEDDPPGGQIMVKAASKDAAQAMISQDPNLLGGTGEITVYEWRAVAGPLMSAFTDISDA